MKVDFNNVIIMLYELSSIVVLKVLPPCMLFNKVNLERSNNNTSRMEKKKRTDVYGIRTSDL